jgi:antitoxin ChpS
MTDPKNLENWLHEKAGPAHDALKADPARAVSPDRVRYTLDELLAEAEASACIHCRRNNTNGWMRRPLAVS